MSDGEPRYWQLRDFDKALNSDVLKKSSGSPPWVKDYCGQWEDPEYAALNLSERGLLKDLRLLAARRGNKILNDLGYIKAQVRAGKGARLAPPLHKLVSLGFLEPFNLDTNSAAKQLVRSRDHLETLASQGSTEERRVEKKNPPTPLTGKNSKNGTGPPPRTAAKVVAQIRGLIAGHGWDETTDPQSRRDEIDRIAKYTLDDAVREQLAAEWDAAYANRYPAAAELESADVDA